MAGEDAVGLAGLGAPMGGEPIAAPVRRRRKAVGPSAPAAVPEQAPAPRKRGRPKGKRVVEKEAEDGLMVAIEALAEVIDVKLRAIVTEAYEEGRRTERERCANATAKAIG